MNTREENNKLEDLIIIKRLLEGKISEFEKIEKKYRPTITLLIRKMIKNEEDVQDLVQEIFIKIYSSIEKYNQKYPFSAWIYKIASNHCIDFLRKKRLQTISISYSIDDNNEKTFDIQDNTSHPEQELINNENKNILQIAMSKLPDKYQEIIRLRHEEDMDYKGISYHLKIPIGTVKAQLFRARKLLYEELKNLKFSFNK